jgi:F0F1-type ATP synthase assembly protein I
MLDKWLGTSPILCIICFFLGAGGGFLTIYRTMQSMDKASGLIAPAPADDEDED